MQEKHGITPAALLSRPQLARDLVHYYNAFNILDGRRGGNMAGEQPIKISEMVAYLSASGEDCVESRMKFIRLMSSMDNVTLKHKRDKAAK